MESIESEENIFRLSRFDYPFSGCCQTQDDRHADMQKQGYIMPAVVRDGPIAPVIFVRPNVDGTFQVDGIDKPFRLGDSLSPAIASQALRLTGDLRDTWSAASPHWEAYEGSIRSRYPKEAPTMRGIGIGLGELTLGLVAGATLATALSLLRRTTTKDPAKGNLAPEGLIVGDPRLGRIQMLREKGKVLRQEDVVRREPSDQAETETGFDSV